ncbi:MAG TPA: hypothetical protein V6D19_12990 [Stenomitos sp.]
MFIKLVIFLLTRAKISNENRLSLTNAVLDKLGALPVRDAIRQDETGALLVNDRPVDLETAKLLRESARGALNSMALKVVREQVEFAAITVGVHQATDPWAMIFGKSAIWYHQQQEKYLKILVGQEDVV